MDDDGNGFVDDVSGWDLADDNSDVSPPVGREGEFFHGTHLAGIIVQIAKRAYGPEAAKWVRIMPVKSLEDDFEKPYLKKGYNGIQYALDIGADIILASWGEARSSREHLDILDTAEDRGVLVVSTSGNSYSDNPQFPAAFPSVISVAAIDPTGEKLTQSSYGGFVDIVAPGKSISSASSLSDTDRATRDGTSMAAAIIAGSAAVLKLQHPDASTVEIVAMLKNTAQPIEQFQKGEIFFGGKLGAGLVNLESAVNYDLQSKPHQKIQELQTHQGYLARYRANDEPVTWRIRPTGTVDGFWFEPGIIHGPSGKSRLQLFRKDDSPEMPFHDLLLSDWKERIFVPGTEAAASLVEDPDFPGFRLLVEFATQPITQNTLFCKGTGSISIEGLFEDGSGSGNYSPQSDCKWLITAPEGKVIHIEFLEFDTEANTDWLYFFDGGGTQEQIMAVYSGPNIPPTLTSWRNQTLLWFVSDDQNQGKGWKASITFVNPE